MKNSVVGVIPSRYASTRFPGKPLAQILGRPMVQWVYEAAAKAIKYVVVATDDERIVRAVKKFGGHVIMTPRSCSTGTERMAYVARKIRAAYYVNIQGDEPMMHPSTIRDTVKLAIEKKSIATPVTNLRKEDESNPNAVKVAIGKEGRALYFSRSLVPFPRDGRFYAEPYKHLGLYVYPKKDLMNFVSLRPTDLERTEMLEQLRALYHGLPIYVSWTRHDSIGVDTRKDIKLVSAKLKRQISGV